MPYRRTRPLSVTPENPQLNWGDSINKGLVAYYPCNEPGGLKVRCAVNPAQNLTLSSGYTSRLSGPGGAHGRGLKFTNATQIASGALVKAVTGGPCTIACWITIDTMPTLSSIMVALGGAATTDVEYITYIYNNNLCWGHSSDDLQPTIATVSAGQRVFVVGSTNSAKLQSIYKNGWLAGTRTATAYPTVSSTVTLGGQYNANTGNNFAGSIDNVRIYNRALSQSEVTRLYQEPFAGVVYPRRRTISAVASVSGTISATLATPAASVSGTIGVTGTTAATAPMPGAAASGRVGVTGTASAIAPKPVASATGSVGTNLTLTGNAATFKVGALAVTAGGNITVGLTGNAVTSAVGTLSVGTNFTLTGNAATSSVGSLSLTTSRTLTGNSIVSAVGTLSSSFTLPVLGQQSIFSVGTIIATTGVVLTISLTGNRATFYTGALTTTIQSLPLTWALSSDGTVLTCGPLIITYNGALQLPYILTIRGALYTYTTLWMAERAADNAYTADPTILTS